MAEPGDTTQEQPVVREGRHRANTAPSTGPILRVPFPAAGRHQENDLDPKRWPWAVLVTVSTLLALGGGFAWGHGAGATAQREAEVASRVFTPETVVTETVTPRPVKTKSSSPRPGPTVTLRATVTPSPAPGPTVYRTLPPRPAVTTWRTREAPPRPAVVITEEIEITTCFRVSTRGEYLGEIPCP